MTRAERLEEIRKRWVEPSPRGAPNFLDDMTTEAAEDIPWLLSELERMEKELAKISPPDPRPGTDEYRAELDRLQAQLDERPDWLKPRTTFSPMAALLRRSRGKP